MFFFVITADYMGDWQKLAAEETKKKKKNEINNDYNILWECL